MEDQLLEKQKERLIDKKNTTLSEKERYVSEHKQNETHSDLNEEGSESEKDATLETLITKCNQSIISINMALEKIESEMYGTCEECDQAISMKRLNAIPEARLCISCAESADYKPLNKAVGA